MYGIDEVYYAYKSARKKFSVKTYLLLLLWLILALAQFLMVCLIDSIRDLFRKYFFIGIIAFVVGLVLFTVFLLIEKLRYSKVLAFIMSIIIVELQIIATFTLVAHAYYAEMLMYFFICVIVLFIFVLIGIVLPRKMDLSLHVALLFIMAFLFLLLAVYFLMLHILVPDMKTIGYIVFEVAISLTLMFFVMYHAQTIHGMRFAEMRLHDYCLGSLILFHDFLIIFWLTFYWQMSSPLVTPKDWHPTSSKMLERKLNYNDEGQALADTKPQNKNFYLSEENHRSLPMPYQTTRKTQITLDFLDEILN